MPSIPHRRKARLARFTAQAAAPRSSGPLAVTGLRSWAVREPISRRRYTVVKVETAAGVAGYGETSTITLAEMAHALEVVRGRQATGYEVLRRDLGQTPRAGAAINMALLDIVGRFAKAPIYQVLGGPTRFKARAIARLEGATDDALLAECRRAREAGYRAFSVPTPEIKWRNQGQAFVFAARRRLNALRAETGEEMDFVLDGAGALTPGDAASLSATFERFHLLWFDEPCALSNLAAIRKIAAERVTPLGFGRDIEHGGGFQDLLREDAIDILRPDIGRNGISEIRRMAAIAETYYVAVAPYHEGGPVATAAALQLAASIPNFFIQQIPLPAAEDDRRMRAAIAGAAIESVKDGFAALPTGPGLGIQVDEAALARYQEAA